MGNHGGAIVAVKYFKTEGPTNVLEYTGLINLIIVKVDLAAVFTKNCALLEDYKHWSPPGRMSSASWGSGSHFGYKTTRRRGQGSSLTVSRIPTSMTMLAMTRCPLSVPRTHSTPSPGAMSGCRVTSVREVWPQVTGLRREPALMDLNKPQTFILISQRQKIFKMDLSNGRRAGGASPDRDQQCVRHGPGLRHRLRVLGGH